ncbi:MAG TPA: tRNA lysidine(34) synthetase TilS [Steroidobacteraceae bacterium]
MRARGAPARARRRPADSAAASTPQDFTPRWLAGQLRVLAGTLRGGRLCVAFSGGLDSTALLAALAALRPSAGFALRALHLDHHLHPDSHRWAAAALAQARSLRVACESLELRIELRRGESLEAVARERRYGALIGHLTPGELLLTAHHQEDQLETVLLALLRGSGVRGLAAMSPVTPIAHTRLLRPLLPISRAQLEQFARARGLEWIEDLTNRDERFDRNYLRRRVLPSLRERWPAAAATVSRSASHLAEAQGLLERAARLGAGHAADGAALRISVLRRMSLPERRNVLRCWIASQGLRMPDHRRLREIAGPMLEARPDALPRVQWRDAELRRHGDRLLALQRCSGPAPVGLESWDWRQRSWLELGDGAALGLIADRHGEVDLAALPCPLQVTFRQGGERLRGAHGRVPLKDLLQVQGIAPWERAAVPLLRERERIVAVADLWLDAAYRADPEGASERGRLRWRREHLR